MIEATDIRDHANGRWREILLTYGFREQDLTGRNGPCPKCGGADRFRFIDEQVGAVLCNQCFKEKNGDGIAAVRWIRDWTFSETLRELASYLGMTDEAVKPVDIVVEMARRKRVPVDAFRAFGAVAASRDGTLVARVPMFDADMKQISYFDMAPDNEKLLKGLCAAGQPAGLFVATAPKAGESVLITEGVKDAASSHAVGFNTVGLCGSELAAKFARLFAGCDVTIVPDRDETGEKAARTTASRLFGVAASVRIAVLPGACKPKGGDGIREVLAMKDGENLFRSAIANAVDWTPSGEKKRPRLVSLLSTVRRVAEEAITGGQRTLSVGIPALDRAIGGVALGELVVIGARPSHGKSLVAMQWLDAAAAKQHSGLIVSEEMSAMALARRSLLFLSDVSESEWQSNNRRLVFDINEHFAERAEVMIAESCGTAAMAEKMIDEAVSKHGVSIVAVDYAQLLRGDGANRYEQVTNTSVRLKQCAVRNNIVLLLLCQLSRDIDKRPDRVPKMSDLRDSGQIEQDADVILFLQWPWKDVPTYEHPNEYRVYVAKNRNRGISESVIQMQIRASRQRLEEAARAEDVGNEW